MIGASPSSPCCHDCWWISTYHATYLDITYFFSINTCVQQDWAVRNYGPVWRPWWCVLYFSRFEVCSLDSYQIQEPLLVTLG
jgi:hypothetical protein